MRSIMLVCVALLLVLSPTAAMAPPSAGSTDPTFGVDGGLLGAVSGGGYFSQPAMETDGDFLVPFRASGDDMGVQRFTVDGDPDLAFGPDGVVTVDMGGNDTALAVASRGGRAILAGVSGPDVALAAVRSDGSLDPSFSHDGKRIMDVGGANDAALAVAILSDGRIVLAGVAGPDIFVARLLKDGRPDPTFGAGDGLTVTDLGGPDDSAMAIAFQGGKLVVGGRTGDDLAVERYKWTGELDPGFAGDGTVTADPTDGVDTVFDVATDAYGSILAAGSTGRSSGVLARWSSAGVPDTTLNGTGVLEVPTPDGNQFQAVEIQSDGRIVTAGIGGGIFELLRLEANGAPDDSFGFNAQARTDFGGNDSAFGLFIQPDGKLVATGFSGNTVAAARYLAGPLKFQPDAIVGGVGGDLYYGEPQRQVVHLARGASTDVTLGCQNDGLSADALALAGGWPRGHARVRFLAGGTDITDQVNGGVTGWWTPSLTPGATQEVTINVSASRRFATDRTVIVARLVSTGYPVPMDEVQVVVKTP